MSVINQLASALNRRDEVPNQELAQRIVAANDAAAVRELVAHLQHKNKAVPSDCIKVLYEIGAHAPQLIAPYYREFAQLLTSKQNRLVWGAMTALDTIAAHNPKAIYSLLPQIIATADSGSVITRDHAVGVLVKLGALKAYEAECVPLLLQQLLSAPNNQLPMYAEMSLAVINRNNQQRFTQVLQQRLNGLEKESQRKRVEKVLKKLG